jgi:NAD(P)-dependent dehydrogenase (short-subunit alcohol dehydrogenase family)
MELLEFNIDVVVIQPGAIKTEWSGIAQEKLLKTSGNTAYKELAIKHAKMLNDADKTGSDPIVIAKVIAKAVEARRPKTRYYAGKSAWFALTARKLLSDRMFDKMMLNLMK